MEKDQDLEYMSPSLASTVPGCPESPTLLTTLTRKLHEQFPPEKKSFDFNAVAMKSANALFEYAEYYVLYIYGGRRNDAGEITVHVVFNRLGKTFAKCFAAYLGAEACARAVQQARDHFKQYILQEIADVKIYGQKDQIIYNYTSMLSYVPELLVSPLNKNFCGVFEKTIQNAAYSIKDGAHYVQFRLQNELRIGRVVSGHLQEGATGLPGVVYTASFIYRVVQSYMLGILFCRDDAIGFVW